MASHELFLNSKSNQEDPRGAVQLFDQDVVCSADDFEDETVVKM